MRLAITFAVRRSGAIGIFAARQYVTGEAPRHLATDAGERTSLTLTPGGIPWVLWDWARADIWTRPALAGWEGGGVLAIALLD